MKVLVINCGSSSLKYQLIDSETESVLAKGLKNRNRWSINTSASGKRQDQIYTSYARS